MRLATRISRTSVAQGEVVLFYVGQAGFCVKAGGATLYLDAYLSDCCERLFGFRRMVPTLVRPQEVEADVFASTHAHADHLDVDAVPVIARNPRTHFVGAPDCAAVYRELGLPRERYTVLAEGEAKVVAGFRLRAVYAEHGDLAPEAVGFAIEAGGLTIYDAGDTACRPEGTVDSLGVRPDVMIAPINGVFGNLDAAEACRLATHVRPRILIASHFWMFVEHGGDPAAFLAEAERVVPGTTSLVLAPGERLRVWRQAETVACERDTLHRWKE